MRNPRAGFGPGSKPHPRHFDPQPVESSTFASSEFLAMQYLERRALECGGLPPLWVEPACWRRKRCQFDLCRRPKRNRASALQKCHLNSFGVRRLAAAFVVAQLAGAENAASSTLVAGQSGTELPHSK